MFIKKLSLKQVKTKFGDKEKYLITDENGKLYDCWIGNWNKDWKEGMEIPIKPEQIKSREWEGKTYWSIQAPPEARMGGRVDLTPVLDALRKIWVKLDTIDKTINIIHNTTRQNLEIEEPSEIEKQAINSLGMNEKENDI